MKKYPTHPGILIQDTINELGITQLELTKHLNIPIQRLNGVIKGRRGITPDTALRLSKVFRTTPEFWLNLQMTFDLWKAKKKSKLGKVKAILWNRKINQ